jgi:HEAT repeats
MRPLLWLIAAALPLAAQPKLLVNAKLDTRPAAAGLEQTFRPLVTAQPQPAWIAYSVPSTRVNLGCDYVRDGWSQPGVIHLEPPDHAVILFRVDGGAVERIRTLSPDCEIDAGGLPVHWLADVKPAESVALLDAFATERERAVSRLMDGAISAIAAHSDPAADAALQRFLAPSQPESIRLRVVSWFGSMRGRRGFEVLKNLIASDPNDRVRERAIATLGGSKEPEALDLLTATARKDASPRMRMQALSALNRHSGAKVLDTLQSAIESDPDLQVKRRAVSALQSMPDGEGIPLLIQLAKATHDNEVRKQAMTSLGQSRDGRAIAFFEEVLKK